MGLGEKRGERGFGCVWGSKVRFRKVENRERETWNQKSDFG